MDNGMKSYLLLASALTFWLVALYSVHDLMKIAAYCISIISSYKLTQSSRQMVKHTARATAVMAIQQELEKNEIALHYEKQQNRLSDLYAIPQDKEEIRQELIESLEELVQEDTQTSGTSLQERKALYRAIKILLEVKNSTYILEQVLHLSGAQWRKGRDFLDQLLQQGREEKW